MAVSSVASRAASGYIVDPEWGNERERLRLLAHMCDPWTRDRLNSLGVANGWRCLEVGAGNGSIAAWLGQRVGPDGRVVATDIDLRFIDGLDEPNVEILRHDVAVEDFPEASFDLIHARALLLHLPERRTVLRRMASWLAPGGWLLIEDTDSLPARSSRHSLWRLFWEGCRRVSAMDIDFGRELAAEFADAGLADIDAHGELPLVRGRSLEAQLYQLSVAAVIAPFEAEGLMSARQAAELIEQLDQPEFLEFGAAWIGCWGRRGVQ